jgi:hypothetical protein
MAINPFQVVHKHDWCHWCGETTDAYFVDAFLPDNANLADSPTRMVRTCQDCVRALDRAIANQRFNDIL